VLHNGYKSVMGTLYSPEVFYKRVKTFLTEYNPPTAPVHIEWQEIRALFRTIYQLGIKGVERVQYWNLIFWTLFRFPEKVPLAITFSVYGFHFRKVFENHIE
jgi:hypothetical protein